MTDLHRPVRSFVLRQSRISRAQQRARDALSSTYCIEQASTLLDCKTTFGREAPTVLEIGFGMGETTAHIAAQRPDTNFLGVEVHSPGVGSLLKQIEERSLANVRIVQADAVEVVRDMIGLSSLAGIHIFFPDPWPKKRHHKRRLLQHNFVSELSSRLSPGGYLHVATDWQDYAEQILGVLTDEPQLLNTAEAYADRPTYRPCTKFEARGLKLGHDVWDIVFRRPRALATDVGSNAVC